MLKRGSQEEKEDGAQARNRAQGDQIDLVRRLLLRAGVGSRSAKLQELLALDLEPAYVEGWVAWRERRLDDGHDMPVGWLIQCLQDGDALPLCDCGECEGCFARRYGKYADVIVR